MLSPKLFVQIFAYLVDIVKLSELFYEDILVYHGIIAGKKSDKKVRNWIFFTIVSVFMC